MHGLAESYLQQSCSNDKKTFLMLTMFFLFLGTDCKVMSPISKFQEYKSRTNIPMLSATTTTSCFWQEIAIAAETICVSASPLHLITVWLSPLKCLAKNLISCCLLLQLLKDSYVRVENIYNFVN